jgi:NIMA (never in mitosis gene a)-related kinase
MAGLKPPFRAEDMDGLYKKVVKGNFQKLPSHYSVDLNNMVKMFLKVNPQLRPNCDKILAAAPVQRRLDETKMFEGDEELVPELLQTIKVPANLHYLTDKLPKCNYNPVKTRLSCQPGLLKEKFKENEMSHDGSMDSSKFFLPLSVSHHSNRHHKEK